MNDEKKTLLERLTPRQAERLKNLTTEIRHDRITVSFSIDARDQNGRKMSAFYADTVSRKGDDPETPTVGYSNEEIRLVRLIVAKQVVSIVYDEAVLKRMFSPSQAAEELKPIQEAYDARIAKVLEETTP